eukprot:14482412-Heterocapsa_arctica.AAC.1
MLRSRTHTAIVIHKLNGERKSNIAASRLQAHYKSGSCPAPRFKSTTWNGAYPFVTMNGACPLC